MTAWTNEEIERRLIDFRHDLHRNPELSGHEFRTTERIKNVLKKQEIRILDLPLKTGVVAEIGNGRSGADKIALRSDIDALPIREQSDVTFSSQNDGAMHACGHDTHTAIMLGAAWLLKQHEKELNGTVRMLFQPAEETGHGALSIINTGILDDVSLIFGLHNDPTLKVGEMGSRAHALTAAVDSFDIFIRANGSHAARPQEGTDPIMIAGQLIGAVQSIVSRNIASSDNAVISMTQIHGGNNWNVIPSEVVIGGTVRTFSEKVRAFIPKRLRQLFKGIGAAYGAEIELKWMPGPPSVVNDPEWTDFALRVAADSGYRTCIAAPTSIGEDFAFYQERVKGCFVVIGSGGPYPLHHPKFRADDRYLFPASRYFYSLAVSALRKLDEIGQ